MRALRASLTNQDIGESAFGVNDFYNNNNNLGELGKRVDGYKVDGNAVRNIFKLYDDLGEDI
ncbi:hypothetical protein GW750_02435 [bacterium]|nr:hypothetical protein [bacterium]